MMAADEVWASAPPGAHLRSDRPHPAVARIVVPEGMATSYGSGTLVDVRDQFGLVVTNWHVVRDGQGDVEVIFPDGFRSKARPLKVDADWDLAALVIWRPPAAPVAIAERAPQPGDALTICGYGQGQYRSATGRCTQYYAPKVHLPLHMVELDVEARQGDSGGPIFNDRGELAGVLFGAGSGTTLGSFGGRVGSFLATLAPNIGRAADNALVAGAVETPVCQPGANCARAKPQANGTPVVASGDGANAQLAALWADADKPNGGATGDGWQAVESRKGSSPQLASLAPGGGDLFAQAKSLLAVVGVLALAMQVLRAAR